MTGGGCGTDVGSVDGAIVIACLFGVVHKVATRSVRAESDAVESAAQFGLVLGMPLQIAELVHSMSELALLAVFAFAGLFEGSTQFRLVTVAE